MTNTAEGNRVAASWFDSKRIVQLVAFVSATIAAVIMLILPTYVSVTESSGGGVVRSTSTLLEVNGPGVFVVILAPVVFAGIPLLLRGRARQPVSIVCAVLLVGFVVVSLASIGIFFLVAALCAVAAVFTPARGNRQV